MNDFILNFGTLKNIDPIKILEMLERKDKAKLQLEAAKQLVYEMAHDTEELTNEIVPLQDRFLKTELRCQELAQKILELTAATESKEK